MNSRRASEASPTAIGIASSAILLVLIVGLAVLVSRRGLVPLAKLQAATAAIQRGDLSVRCESSSRDELGETGQAVNAMAESLLAANAALHESEARYQLAVAGSNEGLWDWDLTTNMVYLSPRAQEIRMGRASDGIDTRHESEWRQWYQVHPDDAARRDAARRDHLEGRTPRYEGEWRVRHLDGSYHWIHARGICTRDASGRAIRFAGSTTDIDARKRAEDATASSPTRHCARAVAVSQPDRDLLRLVLGAGREPALHVPVEPCRRSGRLPERFPDRQDPLGARQHERPFVLFLARSTRQCWPRASLFPRIRATFGAARADGAVQAISA